MENFCGKRLDGRYEIREIIGVGGMAVVYKAYDVIDDRIVAIKILKDEYLTNEEFKRRFKNESKAIAVLNHSNIVRVYNVSFGDRIQYIVMEYVDGITLKEYIEQQGVINWKEAVHFSGQILAALQHAHDKGIVHQDIKPQNIMLLQDGTIKVTDFGIARFSRLDDNTTSENAIGSVHYISPEQARGEMTDDKADIYSIGVVMYEMLTGKLPFQADSAVSVALMQVQQDPVRPRDIVPTLPIGLEQITMRAMQKNPNERYQSAAEMLMDINEFKRNPSIRFNYNYFVDQEPTKYVQSSSQIQNISRTNADESEVEAKNKTINKTTAIMMGVIAGIVVLAIIIFGILSVFKNKNIDVPNFINKNISEVIDNNEFKNKFYFEIAYDETSDKPDGQIINQEPDASTKIKKGSKVVLYVSGSDNETVIIDNKILSMDEKKAKEYLIQIGLVSNDSILEYSDSVPVGTILRTEPSIGLPIKVGSSVTLYLATDEKETTKVPDLYGTEQKAAEGLIVASNLTVGTITEVDSDLEKGVVVSQKIEKDTEVPVGSKIDFQISTGIPSKSTASITVTLPKIQKSGKIKIYIDNELIFTSGELLLDGAKKTFNVEYNGANRKYKVVANDSIVLQEGVADFTKKPAVLSDVVEYITIIDVTGKKKDEAIKQLNIAGFKNVKCVEANSSTVEVGNVISQTPAFDGVSKASSDTEIILTISIGTGAANPNNDTVVQ